MTTNTTHIDLNNEIERLEREIEEKRQEAAEVDRDSEEGENLEAEFKQLQWRLQRFREARTAWGGTQIEIKTELTVGDTVRIQDRMPDNGGKGAYKLSVLKQAVVDAPDKAPSDPADWHDQIGQWVYEHIDEENSPRGVDVEDFWQEEK